MHICIHIQVCAYILVIYTFCLMFVMFVNHIVQPIVSVTELNSPTVNESLLMECNVTLARGIVGNVVISWKANNTANKVTIEEISPEQLLYTDYYETVPLELSHNNTVYHCEAVVNNSTLLTNSTSIIISKQTGEYYTARNKIY